jgi:conserved hypothetical protein TIGR00051
MTKSRTEITVRYAETDQMGVVYHANYLIWMEIGRTRLIEDLGFRYVDMERKGIFAPVVNLEIQYKKPCRFGETVTVETWIDQYEGVRIVYGYQIYGPDGDLRASARSVHVCVRKEDFKPVSVRKLFPEWHEAYEKAKKKVGA